jgi:very-long-chain enoyl-CoA reductase
MFILYFPATILSLFVLLVPGVDIEFGSLQIIIIAMVVFHFGKRCIEVLFLHKFSGSDGIFSIFLITSSYTLVAVSTVLALTQNPTPTWTLWLGVAIYLIGEAGNFYHHLLLANLRKPNETGYKVPVGGLFGLICCPHYLLEIVAWLGIFVAFPCPTTASSLFAFTLYLLGRSKQTLIWYNGKNLDTPKSWKRVIPYVY